MLKKIIVGITSCAVALVAILMLGSASINAEALTGTQQIQAKIAQQPRTVNVYVAELLSHSKADAEDTFNIIYAEDLDSERILAVSGGYLSSSLATLENNPVASEEYDETGKLVRTYNLMTDPDVATLGEIKTAYYDALQNNYQKYYPENVHE